MKSPLATIALLISIACGGSSAQDGPPRISLSIPPGNAAAAAVEVRGLPASTLSSLSSRRLTRDEWNALLRVTVAASDAPGQPPVAGVYAVKDDAITFRPLFPFDPGRGYEVRFDPGRLDGSTATPIVEIVSLPKVEVAPSTMVQMMYPTADVLPENQLRFYVTFTAPMGRKAGLDYIRLVDAKGREVKEPFLPVDVSGTEFWNGDFTRYTVFVDPGRVKRGVKPNDDLGRSFEVGGTYSLVVDPEWRDARGLPLKNGYTRTFRVGPPVERPLDMKTWKISSPAANTREPLSVTFPAPLDHGLLQRSLGVRKAGAAIAGEVDIDRQETRWSFTPREPWTPGSHQLLVLSFLEDLAGNRIGRAFEVDQFDKVEKSEPETFTLPFTVTIR